MTTSASFDSTSKNITIADQLTNSANMTTTISQSSTLQQGLVQGASQSRSTDITTSNSVINSSSSAVTAQSGDQQWLDNSSLPGWDDQSGSQQNTPRLDHANNPATTSQFSGWGSQPFPSSYNTDAQSGSTNPWPATNNNTLSLNSAWGSQSSNMNRQGSEWTIPSGTECWGQSPATSQSTPSSASAQLNQWGTPSSHAPSTTAWSTVPTNGSTANQASSVATTSASSSSASTATQQWGANSVTGQSSTLSTPTPPNAAIPSLSSPQSESSTTPTSWAGAAAKGLPKPVPKPLEPVDPVKQMIEKMINSPDGWGRPVDQGTPWAGMPEKNKQDESNKWQPTQNNGTAIWESCKSGGPQAPVADKSTWNQKVAGNNDPNVWNGEGSKGKDNALWDDLPTSKESESTDQGTSWNAQGSQSRTVSQSSAGDANSDNAGWSSNNSAPSSAGISRSSPPNSINQQSNHPLGDNGWGGHNGNPDMRKLTRWDSTPGSTRMTDTGNSSFWESGANRAIGGAPSNWNSKPSVSWTGGDNTTGSSGWGPSPGGSSGQHGWGDSSGGSQWQGGAGNRKPSFGWDDGQMNGGEYVRDRRLKSDSAQLGDEDYGDWNESNSVWSSAGGFKQVRKHNTIPENHIPPHMQGNRIGGGGGHYGSGNSSAMMNSGIGNNGMLSTKQQMIQYLMNMKFTKEEANGALINNNMNFDAALAELKGMQQQRGGDYGGMPMAGGPMGDNPFNPNIPPPNMATNALNTPYNLNAQHNPVQMQGSSRMNKPQQQRGPMGGGRNNTPTTLSHQQHTNLVRQLEIAINTGVIHKHMLNVPLIEPNIRVIHQLLQLCQTYQNSAESLGQVQRRFGHNSVQAEQANRNLNSISAQMKNLQMPYVKQVHHEMNKAQYVGGPGSVLRGSSLSDNMSGLSLTNNLLPNNPGSVTSSSSQSRLGIWTDKAPGSSRQGANNMGPSSLHASHSTPNLHGGVFDNNPWSSAGGSGAWANMSPSGQYLDNPESHSLNPNVTQSSHTPSAASSFDIPEFVPGVPWLGANSQKVEDDPNITPGSVARSISVSTTASLNPTGRNSTDLGWGSSSKSSWPGQNLVSTSGGDMWKTGNTRPPPGFGKNMNRSMSMPQGPSEKSAFSPVGSSWDNQQALLSSVNVPWLLLRTVPALGDGNLLKTLCSQHGPLQNFFVNANNGQALVRYNTKEESSKAQKNLNSCSFGETTIMAEFVDESEVQKIVEQCQRQPSSLGRSNSVSAAPGSNVWPNTNSSASNLWGGSSSSTWSALPNSGFLPSSDISGNNFNM